MSSSVQNAVLDRLLDPLTECLTPEVAERIVRLRADAAAQNRIDELADKANEGELSPAEQAEYEAYRKAFQFITLLQARARTVIEKHSDA